MSWRLICDTWYLVCENPPRTTPGSILHTTWSQLACNWGIRQSPESGWTFSFNNLLQSAKWIKNFVSNPIELHTHGPECCPCAAGRRDTAAEGQHFYFTVCCPPMLWRPTAQSAVKPATRWSAPRCCGSSLCLTPVVFVPAVLRNGEKANSRSFSRWSHFSLGNLTSKVPVAPKPLLFQ